MRLGLEERAPESAVQMQQPESLTTVRAHLPVSKETACALRGFGRGESAAGGVENGGRAHKIVQKEDKQLHP